MLNFKMASNRVVLSNFVTKQLLIEHILYDLSINDKDIKVGARVKFDTLFKTISTHIIFCAVEVLFAIQDGRYRKHEFNITLN